jgi:hypothetical protein
MHIRARDTAGACCALPGRLRIHLDVPVRPALYALYVMVNFPAYVR